MDDIYRVIIRILCIFGGLTIVSLGAFIISWLEDVIHDRIKKWKRKRQIKNRFDKPPTAKCYCIDCAYHENENGKCYLLSQERDFYTNDMSFCFGAAPRTRDILETNDVL